MTTETAHPVSLIHGVTEVLAAAGVPEPGPVAFQLVRDVWQPAIVQRQQALARWLAHHRTCKKRRGLSCSCGLDQALGSA